MIRSRGNVSQLLLMYTDLRQIKWPLIFVISRALFVFFLHAGFAYDLLAMMVCCYVSVRQWFFISFAALSCIVTLTTADADTVTVCSSVFFSSFTCNYSESPLCVVFSYLAADVKWSTWDRYKVART